MTINNSGFFGAVNRLNETYRQAHGLGSSTRGNPVLVSGERRDADRSEAEARADSALAEYRRLQMTPAERELRDRRNATFGIYPHPGGLNGIVILSGPRAVVGHLEWRQRGKGWCQWGWSAIEHDTGLEVCWAGRSDDAAVAEFKRCWVHGFKFISPIISDIGAERNDLPKAERIALIEPIRNQLLNVDPRKEE